MLMKLITEDNKLTREVCNYESERGVRLQIMINSYMMSIQLNVKISK